MTQDETWLLTEKYSGEKTVGFFADCERLKTGEPLAYVIGWVPFLDCKIFLDSHPLIPRPETEYWTEVATTEIRKCVNTTVNCSIDRCFKVLDLCAGTGCIGVAVAKVIPEARVTFAEIDPQHLPAIEKNLKENVPEYSNRLEYYALMQGDLFENITERYDYILCNPPYIDPALDRTEESVKVYEPNEALYGGTNGMELIIRIIREAPQHLKHGGQLWLEHEPEQSEQIQKLAVRNGFLATTHCDQFDIERYSILVLQ